MRVCLFFDGKNHMKDLRRAASDRWLDHEALARWTVAHVGGTQFIAAYYYTGVPTPQDDGQERHALSDLLEDLERKPGFFVRRFNRRASTRECPHCNQVIAYTEEKMVDTSLVTDLVVLGMRDAYDIAVVFSGDLDLAPGLNAAHAIGKRVWIATFGDGGLSRSLTRSAWGTIDLLKHLDAFSYADLATVPMEKIPETQEEIDAQMIRELRRAEAHFAAGGGFVGAHYFIHRWKGHNIPDAPELRRQALQRLMGNAQVETYVSEGKTAVRVVPDFVDVLDDFAEHPELPRDIAREGDGTALVRPSLPEGPARGRGSLEGDAGMNVRGAAPMPAVTIRRVGGGAIRDKDRAQVEEDETVEVRLSDTMKRVRRTPDGE